MEAGVCECGANLRHWELTAGLRFIIDEFWFYFKLYNNVCNKNCMQKDMQLSFLEVQNKWEFFRLGEQGWKEGLKMSTYEPIT